MKVRTYLAIASWAVLAVALAQQGKQPGMPRRYVFPTAASRIDSLQMGFQKAVDDLSLLKLVTLHGKDAQGRPITFTRPVGFGFKRMMTATIMHNGVERDTDVPVQASVAGGYVQFFALSNLGKPLDSSGLTLDKKVGPFTRALTETDTAAILEFANKAVRNGGHGTGVLLGDRAEVRPIVASKPECMPCHRGSKVGDPLGVIVFRVTAVKPKTARG